MTLDVTIGKRKKDGTIQQCQNAKKNICDPKHTRWPKESYRSGSNTHFQTFFTKNKNLHTIYLKMRKNQNTNDQNTSPIKPHLKEINKLKKTEFPDKTDQDRLKWLKYWSNKAVQKYGEKAAILFS